MAKTSEDRALYHCSKCGFAKNTTLFNQRLPKCHLHSESPTTTREFYDSLLQEPAVQPRTEVTPDNGICRRFWPEAEVTGRGEQQPCAQPHSPWVTALTAMPKQGLKTSCPIC